MSNGNAISPEFPYDSKFIEVEGSRLHYVEEGGGEPILFLHGNPTSSYLWRNIIPHVSPLGRCIALDLIGMGRSDKPDLDYGFFDHVRYVEGFIEALQLRNLTLVIHDWGSGLGFHYATRHPDNIRAVAFMEAIVAPVPGWEAFPPDFAEIFQQFRAPDAGWELIVNQNFFVEKILPGAILRPLGQAEMDHYRAPFTDPPSRKPLWRWPNEIPIGGEPAAVNEAVLAYQDKLTRADFPKLLLAATPGAILPAPLVEWCKDNLPNLRIVNVGEGLHYIQEDRPHEIGQAIAAWLGAL